MWLTDLGGFPFALGIVTSICSIKLFENPIKHQLPLQNFRDDKRFQKLRQHTPAMHVELAEQNEFPL